MHQTFKEFVEALDKDILETSMGLNKLNNILQKPLASEVGQSLKNEQVKSLCHRIAFCHSQRQYSHFTLKGSIIPCFVRHEKTDARVPSPFLT